MGEIMQKLMLFLNQNQGFFSALLSALSLIASMIAIFITVSTNRRQIKLQIFNERYEIYNRFYELFSLSKNIVQSSLTTKGKMVVWNSSFFGLHSESSLVGTEIIKLENEMESIEPGSKEYKEMNAEHYRMAIKKFFSDYGLFLSDKTLLEKSKLLYSSKIASTISSFVKIYGDIVFLANFADKESMEKLFAQWQKICDDIEENKILDEMEKNLIIK